jgi:Membrane bound O-acyl transferase family
MTEYGRIEGPVFVSAPASRRARKWLVALLPIPVCAVTAWPLPAWIYMWLLAASCFTAAKWVTVSDGFPWPKVSCGRMVAYWLLWPGLNFRSFHTLTPSQPPAMGEWFMAVAKTVAGAVVVWGALRFLPPAHPILIGWIGMIGIAFVLHFGLFHILSNVWRAAGFNASPLMNNPIGATSLARFWGGQWNKAFTDLMAAHVFAPLVRKVGASAATLAVFLISGLIHEIVISLPARGGFGLPTLYFAIQGAGLWVERSRYARKLGLGRGFRGWLFTAIVAGGPAYWLFHPVFVRHVILPMLRAIAAI